MKQLWWNCPNIYVTGHHWGSANIGQVIVWCHQATSRYLNQCWPRSLLPYGVIRPQWVNPHFLGCTDSKWWRLHWMKYTTLVSSNLCLSWNYVFREILQTIKKTQAYLLCLILHNRFYVEIIKHIVTIKRHLSMTICTFDIHFNVLDVWRRRSLICYDIQSLSALLALCTGKFTKSQGCGDLTFSLLLKWKTRIANKRVATWFKMPCRSCAETFKGILHQPYIYFEDMDVLSDIKRILKFEKYFTDKQKKSKMHCWPWERNILLWELIWGTAKSLI